MLHRRTGFFLIAFVVTVTVSSCSSNSYYENAPDTSVKTVKTKTDQDMSAVKTDTTNSEIKIDLSRVIRNPSEVKMTDITNIELQDCDLETQKPLIEFLSRFYDTYLIESFTQSYNRSISLFTANYLEKTEPEGIITDEAAQVYRIPNELFDSFIEENFILEQNLDIALTRQKTNTLDKIGFSAPCTCTVVIENVKTDGKGYYYVWGSNSDKDSITRSIITNAKWDAVNEPPLTIERCIMLDFFAIIKDCGNEEKHDWRLYEWILNPDL